MRASGRGRGDGRGPLETPRIDRVQNVPDLVEARWRGCDGLSLRRFQLLGLLGPSSTCSLACRQRFRVSRRGRCRVAKHGQLLWNGRLPGWYGTGGPPSFGGGTGTAHRGVHPPVGHRPPGQPKTVLTRNRRLPRSRFHLLRRYPRRSTTLIYPIAILSEMLACSCFFSPILASQ